MKTCRKCSQELPLIAFSRNKTFPDGLSTWCKKCRSEYRRDEYAEHNPGRQRATSQGDMVYKTKVCIDCVQELPISRFHRKRSAADGRTSYCIECGNARSVKWTRDNKEKVTARLGEWRRRSPRQTLNVTLNGALKRRPSINPPNVDDLMKMFEEQEGKCALSGIQFTWAMGKLLPTSITIDRIDQSSDYSKGNIRLVCHAINSFRGTMTDEEMLAMARTLIAKADESIPSWRGYGYASDLILTVN